MSDCSLLAGTRTKREKVLGREKIDASGVRCRVVLPLVVREWFRVTTRRARGTRSPSALLVLLLFTSYRVTAPPPPPSVMPILEFAPPSPAPAAAPPAGSKSPLSPASRVLSFNSDNNNPLSTTTATASPVKSGLKSPSTRRSPLDENSSVRFSPVNGRAESRAGPQAVVVEARQEEQQQEDIETEDIAEDKEEEDVSMDMQSEDGATRSGAGAPATQLSRSGSASSVASAAGDLVPLHG